MKNKSERQDDIALKKTPTGIEGLDELTRGGLPGYRTTLVAGGPGCGKTVLAMEFLIKGITLYDEPGVFFSFEEDRESLMVNFVSMGYDLYGLENQNKLKIDHVELQNSQIVETGDFSLDPLFLRLEYAISQTGARRVVIDTIETLFSSLTNRQKLRSEIKRLFTWLHEKRLTAIVTGELGEDSLTRQGLEEYVSDCVIKLDHRVVEQISKRRLRIIKYRGSSHITDECPFLITDSGVKVFPVTSLELKHTALDEKISTGIPDLDDMMDGKGFIRASSILISGTAGTGKSSFAASFAHATCTRGDRCLYFSFEESPDQISRNMSSIGIDLSPFVEAGSLHIISERTSTLGLEEHLSKMMQIIQRVRPKVLIMDPISNFLTVGRELEVKSMLTRLLDYLKQNEITGFFTNLADPTRTSEQTNAAISSIMDTWLILRDHFHKNEKRRIFYLLKSRGMHHSLGIKEMFLSGKGISLKDPDFTITHAGRITM